MIFLRTEMTYDLRRKCLEEVGISDEISVHACKTFNATSELETLMSVADNIISPQTGTPIISFVQNSIVAIYLLTRGKVNKKELEEDYGSTSNYYYTVDKLPEISCFVPQFVFHDACMKIKRGNPQDYLRSLLIRAKDEYADFIKDGRFEEHLPGRLYFSLTLPEGFSYDRAGIKIKNGIVCKDSKPITKRNIGTSKKHSIVAAIFVYYLQRKVYRPQKRTADWLSDTYFVLDHWYEFYGMSIGVDDMNVFPGTQEIIHESIQNGLIEHKTLYHLHKNRLKGAQNDRARRHLEQEYEVRANAILNSVRNVGERLVEKGMLNGDNNGFVLALKSGAKGDSINCAQTSACLGQQNVCGSRPALDLADEQKSLSCFLKGDNSPEARGFISRSFRKGLSPSEMFFHSKGGREGVVDTSVKTKDSGYLQKKISRMMENISATWYGMCANECGDIVSFLYGGDMLSARIPIYNENGDVAFFNKDMFDLRPVQSQSESEKLRKIISSSISLPYSTEASDLFIKNARINVNNELEGLYPVDEKEFENNLEYIFNACLVDKGTPVGMVATSSITERATQMTLSYFHNAGIGERSSTPLLVRLKELTNLTPGSRLKNTYTSIFLSSNPSSKVNIYQLAGKDKQEQLRFLVRNFEKEIVAAKLGDFVECRNILYCGEDDEDFTFLSSLDTYPKTGYQWEIVYYDYFKLYTQIFEDYEFCDVFPGVDGFLPFVMVLTLSIEKLYLYNVSAFEIATMMNKKCHNDPICFLADSRSSLILKFENNQKFRRTSSTRCETRFHITPDIVDNIIQHDDRKSDTHEKSGLNNQDYLLDIPKNGYTKKNKVLSKVKTALVTQYNGSTHVKSLSDYTKIIENRVPAIIDQVLFGIEGITDVYYKENRKPTIVKTEYEDEIKLYWNIETDGSNITGLCTCPFLDPAKILSNDVWDVYYCLGIDAARAILKHEFSCLFGDSIESRHYNVIVDTVTRTGKLASMHRNSVSTRSGCITKCFFETNYPFMVDYAVSGSIDKCLSAVPNIITGQEPKIGTGSVGDFIEQKDKFEQKSESFSIMKLITQKILSYIPLEELEAMRV